MLTNDRALEMVSDGMTLGLGSGRAATAFIKALGARVKAGMRVRGVPTSETTAGLARELGIPMVEPADAGTLDIAFDGADEVDPRLQLIKGYGGALVREKIVAAMARKFVVLVGTEKVVQVLGDRGKLPVEVVPFGLALARRKLGDLGMPSDVRQADGKAFVTDNGNLILDCKVSAMADAPGLERAIEAIPGVVGTGLFLGMADAVLVQDGDGVRTLTR